EAQPPEAEPFPEAAAHSTPKQVTGLRPRMTSDLRPAGGEGPAQSSLAEDSSSPLSSGGRVTRSPARTALGFRTMQTRVALLDGSQFTCIVEKRSRGLQLFEKVCDHLNLLERDYFSLSFRDADSNKNWLDPAKEIKKQVRGVPWNFSFNVKFYPPNPAQLSEDITRYFLCLQLRQDIVSGRLPCSFATHAVLGSYTVQSELGDYDSDECAPDYVSELCFAPNQTKEMEAKIVDLHRTLRGMSPAEAEMHFLENVKKLSMYGVDLHHAKDSEGVAIMLGVCNSGLLVYRDRLRINRFSWPKILKISYKRNNFYIKIRPGEFDQFESIIGFKLLNHRAAKRLWKVCVEHHSFFRLLSPEEPPKKFLSLGSKFRYSGRTQIQSRRASAQISRPAPNFPRCISKRNMLSRSLDGGTSHTSYQLWRKPSSTSADMGSGLYGASKAIAVSDHIATVTRRLDDRREEPGYRGFSRKSSVSTETRHQGDQTTELTDTVVDGDLTVTEETLGSPEDIVQTSISALRRSFLEGEQGGGGMTEWDKRLASSPLRRADDAPMIEPLEPEEVCRTRTQNRVHPEVRVHPEPKPSFNEMSPELMALLNDDVTAQQPGCGDGGGASDGSGKREASDEDEDEDGSDEGSSDDDVISVLAQAAVDESMEAVVRQATCGYHDDGESEDSQEEGEWTPPSPRPMSRDSTSPTQQSPHEDEEEVPVMRKTLTYEAPGSQGSTDPPGGLLLSSQTFTAETSNTTTTTHITKMVKGGVSETRVEKRIVISGDTEEDHEQALAAALCEARRQHPELSVTRVVVHKETEVPPDHKIN
uniref:Erythrocyte membrane protein band 4.1 like 3 n=1 Tax=Poecilia formosa TaxID=48698 RepID=A0A087XVN5_POEFO